MGFRQPTATGAFFAQAKAGAEEQKKAREKLQKPQALGGSASVGTQMVASTTGQQQQATQQVQEAGQKAATDIKVDPNKLGSATTTAIAPPQAQPAPWWLGGGPVSPHQPVGEIKMDTGESGNVAAVEASNTAITNAIDATNKQIDALNNTLKTANAEDSAKIQAEKARLEGLLRGYQDKLTKENLGQIAGPSTFEQQMLEREQLLSEEGGNVGKLAALFGKSRGKYGALESQIYGKDIEAIQEASKAGLQEKAAAERGTDVSLEQYDQQLKESQKNVEAALKKENDKLDILKMSPQELAGYDLNKLIDIFGSEEEVKKYINIDEKTKKPISTKSSSTRKALEDRLTQLKTESGKFETAKSKAQQVAVQQLETEYFPKDKWGTDLGNPVINSMKNTLDSSRKIPSAEVQSLIDKYTTSLASVENNLKNAIKRGDKKDAEKLQNDIKNLRWEFENEKGKYVKTVSKSEAAFLKEKNRKENETKQAKRVVEGLIQTVSPIAAPLIKKIFGL